MIRDIDEDNQFIVVKKLTGLSTDTKPTAWDGERLGNGSTLFCTDNKSAWLYNGEEWGEV